jgi:hypothetical protein
MQYIIELGLSLESGFFFEYCGKEEITPKSGQVSFEVG